MLLNRVSRGGIPLCIRSLPSVEPPAGDVDPGVAGATAAVGVVPAVGVTVGVVPGVGVTVGVVPGVGVTVGVLPGVGVTATGVFTTAVG